MNTDIFNIIIMALTQQEMTAQLEQAMYLIDDVRCALENEHPAIHQDLVEVRWFDTAEVQPDEWTEERMEELRSANQRLQEMKEQLEEMCKDYKKKKTTVF